MSNPVKSPSLFLLICLLGFPQISETIYTPSLPDLAQALNIHMDLAELTLSIYFMGFAFGVLAFGILADLIGRKKSMLLGIGIYFLGSLGCSLSKSIDFLLFFRFVQAFGAAAGSVVTQTMLRDIYTGAERSRVFALAAGALSFSPALGPFIGGLVVQIFEWKANFYILCAMGGILGWVSWIRLPETKPVSSSLAPLTRSEFLSLFKDLLLDPKVLCYALLIGGCNGIIFSYYAEAPFIFIELLKLTPFQYGLLGAWIALAFFLASFLSIRLNRHYPVEKVVSIGAGITCAGSMILSLVCGFGEISPGQGMGLWIAILFSVVLIFLGIGVMIPNCLSQALVRYQNRSGSAGSIFGFGYYWIIAGFTALMGYFHNGSATAMPLYFCGISFGMLWVSARFFRSETRDTDSGLIPARNRN